MLKSAGLCQITNVILGAPSRPGRGECVLSSPWGSVIPFLLKMGTPPWQSHCPSVARVHPRNWTQTNGTEPPQVFSPEDPSPLGLPHPKAELVDIHVQPQSMHKVFQLLSECRTNKKWVVNVLEDLDAHLASMHSGAQHHDIVTPTSGAHIAIAGNCEPLEARSAPLQFVVWLNTSPLLRGLARASSNLEFLGAMQLATRYWLDAIVVPISLCCKAIQDFERTFLLQAEDGLDEDGPLAIGTPERFALPPPTVVKF